MLKTTFIARASDGLSLCETYDTETNQQSKPFPSDSCVDERLKTQARDLLKKSENFKRDKT